MRFFVLLSLLITLWVVPCKAQTYALQGMVTDTLKQTVENAVISLSRNDTLVGSCLTDAKGIYLFSEVKAGKYVLSVSHFNYRPLVEAIELNGNKNLNHVICPISQINLDVVVVTADRSNVIRSNAMGTTFHLSAGARKSRTVYNALQEIPLLQVDPIKRTLSAIDGSDVVVLINGMQTEASLETIDPTDIEAVEIIDNPPVKYMKDGFSQVINLKLKRKERNYQQLNLSTSQHVELQTGYTSGIFETGNQKYSFYVGCNWFYHRDSSIDRNFQRSGITERTQYWDRYSRMSNYVTGFGGDYLPNEKNYLSYRFQYSSYKTRGTHDGTGEIQSEEDNQSVAYTAEQRVKDYSQSYVGHVYHRWNMNERNTFEQSLKYYYTPTTARNRNTETGDAGYFYFNEANNDVHQQEVSYNAYFMHTMENKNVWSAGSNLSYLSSSIDNLSAVSQSFDYRKWNEYLYLSYSGSWKNLSYMASAGADLIFNKTEQVKDHYVRLKFAGNMHYRFNKANSLRFFTNGYTSTPSISLLNPYNTSTDSLQIVKGNPELKPSYITNVGLNYQLYKGRWFLNAGITYIHEKDMPNIVGVMSDNVYTRTYENKDKQHTLNPSLNMRYNIPKWGNISLYGGYRHVYWETRDKGWFYTQLQWMLYCKQFTWTGLVNVQPYSYSEFGKTKSYTNTQTVLYWNVSRNWTLFADLRYIAQRAEFDLWTNNEKEQYYSHINRTFPDRHFRLEIGFQLTLRNKVKGRKTEKLQIQDPSVRLLQE